MGLFARLQQAVVGKGAVVVATPNVTTQEELLRVDAGLVYSGPWTIALSIHGSAPATGVVNDDLRFLMGRGDVLGAYAEVEWGQGSALYTAQVDWRLGQRFAVCGSSVRVRFVMPQRAGLPGAPYGWPMRFSASLTPGDAGICLPPTRKVQLRTLAAGATSLVYPVPMFARRFYVVIDRAGGTTPALALTWRQGDGTAAWPVAIDGYPASGNRSYGDIAVGGMVPPEATWFLVTNNAAADTTPQVVFELML